ncbi:SMI1/KNR4 family protein [Psychromonas sp. Urea-02u-13]|uniref:SMI1/KNR4 family protein n=1 Tax=Psychromonas sp. Urea-02u-13 TaxID=2058326 RepID=UPI000C32F1C0|nr:SMI1/KNR4 family protein [Psychromonas sp. Urea-02u-13]PKG36902.1 hypothetical protein CXF74_21740 [Psychromonas sp. Urea-02u-13]
MIQLPISYIEHVKNGGITCGITCGETDLEWTDYFDLEPLDQIIELNHEIEINKYAPGFIAFASNGSGDIYVFDSSGIVYLLPLIGMESEAVIKIANSWGDFLAHVKNT